MVPNYASLHPFFRALCPKIPFTKAAPATANQDMAESRILLEETNPYGSRVASLEEDGRTLYLYMSPPESLPGATRACWVRNLIPAPATSDVTAMQAGQAPMVQRAASRIPDGQPLPALEELDLVWFQPPIIGPEIFFRTTRVLQINGIAPNAIN